jgi:adenine phosphoribosyltransferase
MATKLPRPAPLSPGRAGFYIQESEVGGLRHLEEIAMTKSTALNLADFIRDIPDFPKPGILFRDITPLLANPQAYRQAICQLADHYRGRHVSAVAAVEARGFLFAAPLALELSAALVPIRKVGKLPYETMSHTYDLEYGSDTLEMHTDAVQAGANVLIVDDLLATGGTMEACCRLVEMVGGKVAGCAFLVELAGLGGAEKLQRYEQFSLLRYEE